MTLDLFKNRKGNVMFETLIVVISLVVFIVIALLLSNTLDFVNDEIQASPVFPNESKEVMQDRDNSFPQWADGLVLFLVVMLWLAVIMAAFLIDANPVFFVIVIIMILALSVVGVILANSYEDIAAAPMLADNAAEMPFTNFIIGNLLWYVIGLAITIGVVLYAKSRN